MPYFLVELKATILVQADDEAHAVRRVEDSDDTDGQTVVTEEICAVTEYQSGP